MVGEVDAMQPPVALGLLRTREVFFPGRLFKLCNGWYVFAIFDGVYFQELHTLIHIASLAILVGFIGYICGFRIGWPGYECVQGGNT